MAAHTKAVCREDNGVAAHYPLGRLVKVAGVGEVVDFSALGADDADIRVGVVLVSGVAYGKPFSVRRPGVVHVASGGVVLAAVGNLACLAAFDVKYHQAATAFNVGQFLAVGRVLRIATVYAVVLEQGFLFNQRGVCQVRLILAHYGGGIDVPVAVALRSIGDGSVVRSKGGGNF